MPKTDKKQTKNAAIARLTGVDATQAWTDLIAMAKRQVVEGKRQVPFTATEVVLCLAAMHVVAHNSFGGKTAAKAPSPLPELAALFRRPVSSVVAKMADLAGARPHGAVGEVEAAQALLADGGAALLASYRSIITAARAIGLTPKALPDFLPVRPWVAGGLLPPSP